MQYADELALFCKNKKKPIMIAESTPFGGIKQGVGLGGNEAGIIVFLTFLLSFLTTISPLLLFLPLEPERISSSLL